jgi:3-methyladenine DNA glycosylase AlkD
MEPRYGIETACLAGHDGAPDARFLALLPVIEKCARDERNVVKKGVSWALRRIGGRSGELLLAATAVAERLARSPHASCRFVGKDALRDFAKHGVRGGKRK